MQLHTQLIYGFVNFVYLCTEKSSSSWCQLAYWEQSQRVGRLFPVENPAVNIFAEQTRGDGLCLSTLAMQRINATPDAVLKARQKIGLGKFPPHTSTISDQHVTRHLSISI